MQTQQQYFKRELVLRVNKAVKSLILIFLLSGIVLAMGADPAAGMASGAVPDAACHSGAISVHIGSGLSRS